MTVKTIRAAGAAVLAAVWLGLSGFAWLKPSGEISLSERRKLAQFPALSVQSILDGTFMTDFEDYTLDQFPLRDTFRQLKALFHYNVLFQRDNNGIFLHDGYAAKLEYPLNETSVRHALERFNSLYESYLKDFGSKVYVAVVPDKSYYLAQESGCPAMDYERLFTMVREGMPWANYVNLTDCLTLEDYYYTDTHWRQEKLLPAAQVLCEALGIPGPEAEDYTVTEALADFYGVYYGQAALPMDPEPLYLLESGLLSDCQVYNHETGKETAVYDLDKLAGTDPYDVFLSGATPLLTIENPNAETDRELIVFRDSFGSSMTPLLLQGYKTVTVVDIRYIASAYLSRFVDFHGQDVLFLYSTLVLNSSSTLK